MIFSINYLLFYEKFIYFPLCILTLFYFFTILSFLNEYFHITTRAKAIDASLYIAAAGWARPPEEASGPLSATCLIDWEGKILAPGSRIDPMIVYHDVNLFRPRITEGLGFVEKAEWRAWFPTNEK